MLAIMSMMVMVAVFTIKTAEDLVKVTVMYLSLEMYPLASKL